MINLREIILGALMDIVEEEQYSHRAQGCAGKISVPGQT